VGGCVGMVIASWVGGCVGMVIASWVGGCVGMVIASWVGGCVGMVIASWILSPAGCQRCIAKPPSVFLEPVVSVGLKVLTSFGTDSSLRINLPVSRPRSGIALADASERALDSKRAVK